MTESVLVPIDGSRPSLSALRHALERYPEADITVLHVEDLFEPGYGPFADAEPDYEPVPGSASWYDHVDETAGQVFEEARVIAEGYDRTVDTATEIGDPKRIVLAFANEEDVDQVVLGAHGRTDGDGPLLGTVAEFVVRRAPVAVTVVR